MSKPCTSSSFPSTPFVHSSYSTNMEDNAHIGAIAPANNTTDLYPCYYFQSPSRCTPDLLQRLERAAITEIRCPVCASSTPLSDLRSCCGTPYRHYFCRGCWTKSLRRRNLCPFRDAPLRPFREDGIFLTAVFQRENKTWEVKLEVFDGTGYCTLDVDRLHPCDTEALRRYSLRRMTVHYGRLGIAQERDVLQDGDSGASAVVFQNELSPQASTEYMETVNSL